MFEDEYFVLEYLKASPGVTYVQACEYRYFLPEEFYGKYDFGIDTFRKVTGMIEYLLSEGGSHPVRRIRLPSVVYWYKIALGRYASGHSFRQSREKIAYARKLAWRFSSGLFNHLTVKILPSRIIYLLLKRKKS